MRASLNTQSVFRPGALSTIVGAFAHNEAALRAAAREAARAESHVDVLERMLLLQQDEDFNYFFSFLSRRAPDLISPCHWMAFGVKLAEGNGAPRVPTFEQLQRVIQLVREERPQLQEFTRQLIASSVLGKVVGVERSASVGVSAEASVGSAVARP